ncbi:unnamed protein product [Nippostrongylus brasiliensis]|uniref:Uncharacterized protein n=1 Tax=Nippostrongylus brasiliensis TaxID=27835 RepID=A0A0N4YTL4_NIPBR|nr:unnamed protein product [Nippostrongylus brasiliensis]
MNGGLKTIVNATISDQFCSAVVGEKKETLAAFSVHQVVEASLCPASEPVEMRMRGENFLPAKLEAREARGANEEAEALDTVARHRAEVATNTSISEPIPIPLDSPIKWKSFQAKSAVAATLDKMQVDHHERSWKITTGERNMKKGKDTKLLRVFSALLSIG